VANNKLTSHWPISISNGVAALFNLFLPLALVRVLPPDQVGRYKLFFLYVMMSPGLFLVGGLSNGLYHWAGNYPQTKPEVRQSWTWLVIITFLITTAGLLFSTRISPLLKMPVHDVQILLLCCPAGLACTFLEDLMISRGDIWMGSLYGSGFQIFRSAVTLAAACWGRQVEYVLWAFFGATLLRLGTGYGMLYKSGDVSFMLSRIRANRVLDYAFPVSLAAFAGVALSNVDQLVLSFRLNPTEFAFYALGCLTVPPLQILEISVNRVLIPKLSQTLSAGQRATATALFSEAVSELYRILLPATAGLIVFAHPIIRILFTERYGAASHYLQFYALFYLFMSVPYDAVARARGDGVWILRMAMIVAPLSIVGAWLAAARWGAMGALIAFLGSQLGLRVYASIYQRHHLSGRFRDMIPIPEMLRLTGWVTFLSLVCIAIRPLFMDERIWFLAGGALFTAFYFGGAYGFIIRRIKIIREPIPILEVVQFLDVGGLEKMVFSLCRVLNQNDGFQTLVALYDRIGPENSVTLVPQFKAAGIPVVQWEKRTGFSLRTVTRLVQIIVSQRRRILHAHDLGPLIYGSLAKYLSGGRVQLVFTLHTLLHIEKSARDRMYYKIFLKCADRIIVVSPAVREGLMHLGVDSKRIAVVPNGVSFTPPITDVEEKEALKRQLWPGADNALYRSRWILSLARLYPGKGQDVALQIWRDLPDEIRSQLTLFLVGPSTDRDYRKSVTAMLRDIPRPERVIVPGATSHPDQWLQAADLFFSGSSHEGMPLAPLEAVGSGLPTLLSDIPGHEFLKPWAYHFTLTRPHEGTLIIMDILNQLNSESNSKMAQQLWADAAPLRNKWSDTAMAASYMEVFQSLCHGAAAPASGRAYALPLQ
jgi:O-antigen/teichoic acid export membrane protein/glycosyltransferase involved in cell wall biosynthesis